MRTIKPEEKKVADMLQKTLDFSERRDSKDRSGINFSTLSAINNDVEIASPIKKGPLEIMKTLFSPKKVKTPQKAARRTSSTLRRSKTVINERKKLKESTSFYPKKSILKKQTSNLIKETEEEKEISDNASIVSSLNKFFKFK